MARFKVHRTNHGGMIDYFKVLGLAEHATRNDVKRAYRDMAKLWHPDVNKDPKAPAVFILINEAYEFLLDDQRRANFGFTRAQTQVDAAVRAERELRYKQWVETQRRAARERAAENARTSFDTFVGSRIYRTAMVLNRLYDYIFLSLAAVIVIVPLVVFLSPERLNEQRNATTYVSMGLTVGLGLMFLYFIWKFLFKQDEET
jgi:hypothetical protein